MPLGVRIGITAVRYLHILAYCFIHDRLPADSNNNIPSAPSSVVETFSRALCGLFGGSRESLTEANALGICAASYLCSSAIIFSLRTRQGPGRDLGCLSWCPDYREEVLVILWWRQWQPPRRSNYLVRFLHYRLFRRGALNGWSP